MRQKKTTEKSSPAIGVRGPAAPAPARFEGFPRECIQFYRDLTRNNNTTWFAEHKADYEEYVLQPARLFVMEMGDRLSAIAPGINADPRVNRSIFRIYRDTRFRHDKTPYKTHLGIWFWEGNSPRMECSGFYFHLEPAHFSLGAGMYRFPEGMLDKYREYAVDRKHGAALAMAVEESTADGQCTLGGIRYKRVPRGYDPEHPNAALLLHDGLWAGVESDIPEEVFSPELPDYCLERFIRALPLHRWLLDFLE